MARLAFECGVRTVAVTESKTLDSAGASEPKEFVDLQTSTPQARAFIEKLLASDFYDARDYSINVRAPRSIVSDETPQNLTAPFCAPAPDLLEDLWQFAHITKSFVAACLAAYGMIRQNTLLIIAGLLFLPLLHVPLSISFGAGTSLIRSRSAF